MISFQHTMRCRMGLHARPASDLSALARSFQSMITINARQRSANAKRIVELMETNVRYKDILEFSISGSDEDTAYKEIKKFCDKNL